MLLDVAGMAVFLFIGNVAFRHFDPFLTIPQRILKTGVILAVTALISYFFGHTGVGIAFVIALIPLVYIHGVWLPRHGVNGWTGEPKERYYELRGWTKKEGRAMRPFPK